MSVERGESIRKNEIIAIVSKFDVRINFTGFLSCSLRLPKCLTYFKRSYSPLALVAFLLVCYTRCLRDATQKISMSLVRSRILYPFLYLVARNIQVDIRNG